MSMDGSVISYVVQTDDLLTLLKAGISPDHFVDEYRTVWKYILRVKKEHDAVPSVETLVSRFPDLTLPNVKAKEIGMLINQLRQRKRFIDFLELLHSAADQTTSFESVDDVIQTMQGKLNNIAFDSGKQNHLVDLFSPEVSEQMLQQIKDTKSGRIAGIPTGFKRFDQATGGLKRQKMYTIMGRTGEGKSWLDLFFVASAITQGYSATLYPLEMPLDEVAFRLYTIFSLKMFGASNVLKNSDLSSGRVKMRDMRRFLDATQERFGAKLKVADVSSLNDPYTLERIEAEVEIERPDMFWVDYLTLLKPPSDAAKERDDIMIRRLSSGIKGIAMRHNVIGGCSAQVNRDGIKNVPKGSIPRLEHISFGDSIGQDSDVVVSIRRPDKDGDLFYALVKNRGGMEFGKTRVKFEVNSGIMEEHQNQSEDDD